MRRVVVAAAAVAVAAASLLVQHVPGFDPQGWLLWGRELRHGGLAALDTTAYPSWKPLPALLTTPLAFAGAAAPALWLLIARVGALAAMLLAYRLAARRGGALAGALAVAGIAVIDGWWTYAARGAIEPLMAALVLGAVDRHVAGRRTQAAVLLGIAALGRHEALALYVLYGTVLAWSRPWRAVPLAAGAAAVVALWLGGDWVGSGDPLHGSQLARLSHETVAAQRAGDLVGTTLGGAAHLVAVPLLLGAVVGLCAGWRRIDRTLLIAVVGAAVWVAVDVVMALRGFPAIDRFMVPAAALLCVAGAIGLAQLVAVVRQRSGRPQLAVAVAAAVALLTLVAAPQRVAQQVHAERAYVHGATGLDAALARAGGPQRVRAMGWSTTQHAFQTRLAWRLGVSSSAVRRRVRGPGLAFSPGARPSTALRRAATLHRVGAADGWTVWRIGTANGRT